ncbi:hypothetical protein PIB30_049070 [Stylosanthes scabra]|uniref:Uncharacterized protein n=1 Tax=Stylosanthes scabra TaxID=79078 RepID=A0ABU6XIG2_9FABA|nr:hypothetical protein [Stylosanthes scabra]
MGPPMPQGPNPNPRRATPTPSYLGHQLRNKLPPVHPLPGAGAAEQHRERQRRHRLQLSTVTTRMLCVRRSTVRSRSARSRSEEKVYTQFAQSPSFFLHQSQSPAQFFGMAVINILFENSVVSLDTDNQVQLLGTIPSIDDIESIEQYRGLPEAHMKYFRMGTTSFLSTGFADRAYVVEVDREILLEEEDRIPHLPASLADAHTPISEGSERGWGGLYRLRFDLDFQNENEFYWETFPSPPHWNTSARIFAMENKLFLNVGSLEGSLFSLDSSKGIWSEEGGGMLQLFDVNGELILPNLSIHVEGVTGPTTSVYLSSHKKQIYAVLLNDWMVFQPLEGCMILPPFINDWMVFQPLEGCMILPPFIDDRSCTKFLDMGRSRAAVIVFGLVNFDGESVPLVCISEVVFGPLAFGALAAGGLFNVREFMSFRVEKRFILKIPTQEDTMVDAFLSELEKDTMVNAFLSELEKDTIVD